MQNYSENWPHLKSILEGYSENNQNIQHYSYADHLHAKALSIFLANAALATPKLDRTTVEAVLLGKKHWPHTDSTSSHNKPSLPLSLLEKNGLVAFYADWCTVHCQAVKNLNDADPSLTPLIQAVEYLRNICYGRNGYVRPYYDSPEDELNKLLAARFGNTPVAELLPDLRLEDGRYKLPPGNQHFSPLVSTYLWLALREFLEPKQAFDRWILCLRVNCDWAMPVLFDNLNFEDQIEFGNQLRDYLADDAALNLSLEILWKQSVNQEQFLNIIAPVATTVRLTIDSKGNSRSEHQDIELDKPTLETLNAAYSIPKTEGLTDFECVQKWQKFGHWRHAELFYTSLLAATIESSIRVSGHVLASSGFSETIFELAASRPILKYLLLKLVLDYSRATNFKTFMLSRPATCDVAIFYLSQKSFFNSPQSNHTFTRNIEKGYQQLICHEYLRTIEREDDCGNRLLKLIEYLGDRCNLRAGDLPKSSEYLLLFCLLDNLNRQQVVQVGKAFVVCLNEHKPHQYIEHSQHCWYLIGFWLIEQFDIAGISSLGTLGQSLSATILDYYKAEFEENLAGSRRSLGPNTFFSALPWHKLITHEGIGPVLALSNNCSDWQHRLTYTCKHNFAAASAIRHYLQMLICVGRPQKIPKDWGRVTNRVAEIVRTLGFGPREHATYLFDGAFYSDQYDLWTPFCSYTNLFPDDLYDDFFERCVSRIPLNQLFVLLERCTVIARTRKLQDMIAKRQSSEAEDLGLSGIEQAFISAWESKNNTIAEELIIAAKKLLRHERFANTTIPRFLRAHKVWASYEYKWSLMKTLDNFKHDPNAFENAAWQIPLPHKNNDNSYQDGDHVHWHECERFRRYIIAAAYLETNPKKCVNIMEALHMETNDNNHGFMLFKGRLCLHKEPMELRHALTQFLAGLSDTNPEDMLVPWVATILGAYQQLKDNPRIDAFWAQLSSDQQNRLEILRPYCKALIARSEALVAQQIINRYRELNQQASDDLDLNELIDELGKALPSELSMSQLVQIMNEGSQRNAAQLARHYSQIVSKNFEDYVSIVDRGNPPHEFLKNAILEVAQELLLRRKNLQMHTAQSIDKNNRRITKEDLINDWFTSLFDKRMAEARIGLRDQKRGGQSASGNGPGEIDGYITDAKNNRIAIFEAFRLFSRDTRVIAEHLDKIAGYDNESLSPVFIVVYCAASDFAELARGYTDFIRSKTYAGFSFESDGGGDVKVLRDSDYLWLNMEQRRREQKQIVFYHLLLNMSLQ